MTQVEEIQKLCGVLHEVMNGLMNDEPRKIDKIRVFNIADRISLLAEQIKDQQPILK